VVKGYEDTMRNDTSLMCTRAQMADRRLTFYPDADAPKCNEEEGGVGQLGCICQLVL
jgi:hypothetical protein